MPAYKHDPIIEGMARALFVTAYASQQEERRAHGKSFNVARPGQDWMDVAPRTPRAAYDAAHNLAGRLEEVNQAGLYVLRNMAVKADRAAGGDDADVGTPQDFGHYLAMQALGHGVSWFDDHASFPLKFPFAFSFDLD